MQAVKNRRFCRGSTGKKLYGDLPGTDQEIFNSLVMILRVSPLLAYFRGDPDEFCAATLNHIYRVDSVHISRISVGLKIDGPFRTAS